MPVAVGAEQGPQQRVESRRILPKGGRGRSSARRSPPVENAPGTRGDLSAARLRRALHDRRTIVTAVRERQPGGRRVAHGQGHWVDEYL